MVLLIYYDIKIMLFSKKKILEQTAGVIEDD